MLRQALDRTNTLRYLGEDTFEGRPQEVVTFVMPDTQQVAVYVDARNEPGIEVRAVFVDPLTGEDASEIMFADYVDGGEVQVPQTWTNALRRRQSVAKRKVRRDSTRRSTATSFDVSPSGFVQVAPLPMSPEETWRSLPMACIVIQNVAGQNQNTMAVEFKDYIVAVEAPGSSDGADNVIERIKETIPG